MTSQRTRDRLVQRLRDQGIMDERILDVVTSTPRHAFIDEALAHRAYEDIALPIGFNQTISQPYIVARMTEVLLGGGPLNRVLEIGTGSGYQAAVLAQLVDRVYTVERISGLLEKAVSRFRLLGLRNIQYKHADGGLGWPERGPYDGIIITASPRRIPDELIAQLTEGGRMVVPLGHGDQQQLTMITNSADGVISEVLEAVKFVPLMGGKA
ncbi:MAG: protein-L-isoaspartate(D-aspartate) O-methyltransferase [Proteobacteria bacterium]|nr:protein-L-isoaspartate(D-aspartate) O-methyltransferase [Pseudomonadota bacterium]